jgi:hypothetical protein
MSSPDEEYERAVIAEFDAGDTEATLQAMAAEAKRTEADFEEYHRDRAFHAWKQAMWAKGLKLPTQVADGRVQSPALSLHSRSLVQSSFSAARYCWRS